MAQKSKAEQQLEQMTAERDYWRKLAQQRGEEIDNLERDAERLIIHADVLRGGLIEKYDRHLERLQKERDQARAWAENAMQFWTNYRHMAERSAEITEVDFRHTLAQVESSEQWREERFILTQVAEISAISAYNRTIDRYNNLERAIDTFERDPLVRTLFDFAKYTELASIWDVTTNMVKVAQGLSDAPELIAAEVWKQSERGEIDSALVTKLCAEWDGSPGPQKVIEALTTACAHDKLIASRTQASIASEFGISTKTLQRHLKIADQVKRLAFSLPELIERQIADLEHRFPDAVAGANRMLEAGK